MRGLGSALLERLEDVDGAAREAARYAQRAQVQADRTAARYAELEQAIAANFGLTLSSKGG